MRYASSVHDHSFKDSVHLLAVAILIIQPGAQVGFSCDLGTSAKSFSLIFEDA